MGKVKGFIWFIVCVMKKCFKFENWKEIKDIMISLNEEKIIYRLLMVLQSGDDDFRINQSTPTDPILAKLCELTGAKMYGDYVLLSNCYNRREEREIKIGDMFLYHISNSEDFGISILYYDKYYDVLDSLTYKIKKEDEAKYKNFLSFVEDLSKNTNIFQEYSNFLRKEESKWEELRGLFDL